MSSERIFLKGQRAQIDGLWLEAGSTSKMTSPQRNGVNQTSTQSDLENLSQAQLVGMVTELRQTVTQLNATIGLISRQLADLTRSRKKPTSKPTKKPTFKPAPSAKPTFAPQDGPSTTVLTLPEPVTAPPRSGPQTAPPSSAHDSHAQGSMDLEASQGFQTVENRRKRPRKDTKGFFSESSSSETEEEMEVAPKQRAPPPITILEKSKWPLIQDRLRKHSVSIRRAVNVSNGVRVYARTVDDFRTLTRGLDSTKVKYTTNQLPEDRDLVVVIRGVTESITEQSIADELTSKPLPIRHVHRMRSGDKAWPLVAVHLDPSNSSAKSIFDLKTLCGLAVKVEAKRKSKDIPQCRRCLKFFHTANYCHADWVCSFCGRNHATPACTSKDDPRKTPSCANCKGEHRATYKGCPKIPQKPKSKTPPANKPPTTRTTEAGKSKSQPHREIKSAKVQPQRSFANVLAQSLPTSAPQSATQKPAGTTPA